MILLDVAKTEDKGIECLFIYLLFVFFFVFFNQQVFFFFISSNFFWILLVLAPQKWIYFWSLPPTSPFKCRLICFLSLWKVISIPSPFMVFSDASEKIFCYSKGMSLLITLLSFQTVSKLWMLAVTVWSSHTQHREAQTFIAAVL